MLAALLRRHAGHARFTAQRRDFSEKSKRYKPLSPAASANGSYGRIGFAPRVSSLDQRECFGIFDKRQP
jgi:hypothetical protein